jgi:magnesium transporter
MSDKAGELVIDHVYIVDSDRYLRGVASLKDLLQVGDDTKVKKITKRRPVTVNTHANQERIIYRVLKDRLNSIQMVDSENRLESIVPYDAILDIFHHEFREDILSPEEFLIA